MENGLVHSADTNLGNTSLGSRQWACDKQHKYFSEGNLIKGY